MEGSPPSVTRTATDPHAAQTCTPATGTCPTPANRTRNSRQTHNPHATELHSTARRGTHHKTHQSPNPPRGGRRWRGRWRWRRRRSGRRERNGRGGSETHAEGAAIPLTWRGRLANQVAEDGRRGPGVCEGGDAEGKIKAPPPVEAEVAVVHQAEVRLGSCPIPLNGFSQQGQSQGSSPVS